MHPDTVTAAQTACEQLGDMLAGLNYVVSFDLVTGPPAATPETAAVSAPGPAARVGRPRAVLLANVLDVFESCARYPHHPGSHGPDLGVVGSERFQELVCAVAVCLEQLAADAEFVGAFRLYGQRGIMWNFAFVFHGPAGSAVFTGWSSD